MSHRPLQRASAAASIVLVLSLLVACAPEQGAQSGSTPGASTQTPSADATGTPSPTPTVETQLPSDCRAILSEEVLAELGATPLNDPVFGPSGMQPDGTLICIWGDPAADTTHLTTTITTINRGPALDMLNQLAADEGFSCYAPEFGTRCEKTWQNEQYPVIDGRTLYFRNDILIDTVYSNLAPTGYTASIVESIYGTDED